jgi:hypothetical protein
MALNVNLKNISNVAVKNVSPECCFSTGKGAMNALRYWKGAKTFAALLGPVQTHSVFTSLRRRESLLRHWQLCSQLPTTRQGGN